MRPIIRECIERLINFSKMNARAFHYKIRARVVADSLTYHFVQNDLHSCETIIFLENYNSEENKYDSKWLRAETKERSQEHHYLTIISETHEKLTACKNKFSSWDGIKIVHRVWLGRNLSHDEIKKILSCNIHLQNIWVLTGVNSKKRAKLKFIIWTNNKHLLASNSLYPNLEIRNYRELLEIDKRFSQYVESFIYHKEFAFASDILRFIAIYNYGGLFLGIGWYEVGMYLQYKTEFEPTLDTIQVFFTPVQEEEVVLEFNYGITTNGEIFSEEFVFTPKYLVDSEILYTGIKFSPFIGYILEMLYIILSKQDQLPRCGRAMTNSRAHKKRSVQSKRFASNKEEFQAPITKDISLNTGISTNVYPLCIALAHMEMFLDDEEFVMIATYDLLIQGFKTKSSEIVLFCKKLGITRPLSASWTKFSSPYRPYGEC